jgi:hypothetical protein
VTARKTRRRGGRLKGFEETRKGERRPTRAPAESADSLGLASAVGNRGMQRIAESPEAGRVGPAALTGSGGVLARTSDEGGLDEETEGATEPSGEEPADLAAPEEAEEDPTVD